MDVQIIWLIILTLSQVIIILVRLIALRNGKRKADNSSPGGSKNESAAHYIPGKSKICIDQGKEMAEMKVEIKNIKAIFKVADIKNSADHQMLSTKIDHIKNSVRHRD
ncbi:unnamed protein product [marine sediment metagenome]|uniref:Uncharacterized protein n=1 Tax=marine sediment metagenome TaxID=412755 RepID=X1IJW5_9ZZZZ